MLAHRNFRGSRAVKIAWSRPPHEGVTIRGP